MNTALLSPFGVPPLGGATLAALPPSNSIRTGIRSARRLKAELRTPGTLLALLALFSLTLPAGRAADAPRPPMKNLLALSSAQARTQPEATASTTAAHASSRMSVPEPVVLPGVPVAVFVDEPGTGIDPFFPHSRRRPARVSRPATAQPGTVPVLTQPEPPRPAPLAVTLSLRGIVGPGYRRLALISANARTYDVQAGEALLLRNGPLDLRVTCVEIREGSVLIRVDGETTDRELQLKEGI